MTRPTWIGKKLGGRYLIQELLGQGGMSAVYKALDQNLNRIVAVKLIHPHLSTDPEFVRRFEEEAWAVAQLRHPNIIQVFDYNHDEDVYFIVFEFVPGETLQARLKRLHENERRMDIDKTISVGASVADALDYAHSRNLIHRDVKPANVMLNVNNEPVLMDFGIVKIMGGTQHTATGAVMGTARYMSPEQIRGERVDERTDIYSLGVLLFEMAGGRAPFEADSAMTIMMMHINDPVPNLRQLRPDVPPGLVHVINKTLNKDREQRFSRASDIAKTLRDPGLASTDPSAAAAPTVIEPAPPTPGLSRPQTVPAARPESPPPETRRPAPSPPITDSAPPGGEDIPVGTGFASRPKRPVLIGGAVGLLLLAIICIAGVAIAMNNGLFGGEDPEATLPVVEQSTPGTPEEEQIGLEGGAEQTAAASTATAEAQDAGLEATSQAQSVAQTATAAYASIANAEATAAQATADAQHAAMTATAEHDLALTATALYAPTATPTVPPGIPYARINSITLQDGRYIVEYETFEYTETLPGMHVHFFFDTVPPEQAGVPGAGPWFVYGGPRPFTGYTQADRPAAAEEMCILVANTDHSAQANSGNCYPLPTEAGG